MRAQSNGSGANGSGNHRSITTVRPWMWYRTGSVAGGITNLTSVQVTGQSNGAVSGAGRGLGPSSGAAESACDLRCCLLAFWKGTDATTVAQTSTLTTLGW